jgi:hypothetical protein
MSQTGLHVDDTALSNIRGNESSNQVVPDPSMIFVDDLMLDFGMVPHMDPLMVEDPQFQDMQDLPWYAPLCLFTSLIETQEY